MKPLKSDNAPVRIFCLLAVAAGAVGAQSVADEARSWTSQICPAGETGDCYLKLNQPEDCYIWSDWIRSKVVIEATWSGACEGSLAQGKGTLTLERQDRSGQHTGTREKGRLQSQWVGRHKNGLVREGAYRDGKRHGQWIERWVVNGHAYVQEGTYSDGKKHGPWVLRGSGGYEKKGTYSDGKKHGPWVLQGPDGYELKSTYSDGKLHGPWVLRGSGGYEEKGTYSDGKLHGPWVKRGSGGYEEKGTYSDGKKHGPWVKRWPDGTVEESSY